MNRVRTRVLQNNHSCPDTALLQSEIRNDKVFLSSLHSLRENWNIRPLTRQALSRYASPGPVGAIGVHLGLSPGGGTPYVDNDCDAVIMRAEDGCVVVRMGPDFMVRRLAYRTDRGHVALAVDGVKPGGDVSLPVEGVSKDAYLLVALKSVLENDVFRTLSKEALAAGRRQGVHCGQYCVTCGPLVARMHARKIVVDGQEGAGVVARKVGEERTKAGDDKADGEVGGCDMGIKHQDGGASKPKVSVGRQEGSLGVLEEAGEEGGREKDEKVLSIVARQLLLCEYRLKARYKPGQGKHQSSL